MPLSFQFGSRVTEGARASLPRGISDSALAPVGSHERIAEVRRRHERLLDGARAHPADQVPHRAGFVVRARGARAPERLLRDYGAGRLVVQVQVPRGVAELVFGV